MGIKFPYLSECHRQIPFLESIPLPHVLCQLVLIKENKAKLFIAWRVLGTRKQLKIIIPFEYTIVKNPINKENL